MKGFLNKVLLFFLILLIAVAGTFGITYLLSYRNVSNITLDDNIHTIICGDSHTKTALNDSVIPNSLNISHSSEHYLYTYNVLKVLLRNNPQVRTVILGFSFHNMSSYYDDNLFEPEKTQYMYPRYISVLDRKAFSTILTSNVRGFVRDIKDIYQGVNRHIGAKELSQYGFIGGFYDSDRANKNDSTLRRALMEHYYNPDQSLQGFSTFQLLYLRSISDLCREANVRLILMNCPVSREYRAQIPAKFIANYYGIAEEYENAFMDYHDYFVPEESYGDGDHLNKSGSKLFSLYFLNQKKSENEGDDKNLYK